MHRNVNTPHAHSEGHSIHTRLTTLSMDECAALIRETRTGFHAGRGQLTGECVCMGGGGDAFIPEDGVELEILDNTYHLGNEI